MTDTEMCKIVLDALYAAGKFMRDNPPGDISTYPPGLMTCLIGGMPRDPEGKEFAQYFLNQSIAKHLASKETERV